MVGRGGRTKLVCRLEGLQVGMLGGACVPEVSRLGRDSWKRQGWRIGIGLGGKLRGRGVLIASPSGKE
jgi:hypothetical protein